ncbi:MAG: hypothetical protein EZS28_026106 [Streblomastix strix]|uniref:Uncharacterized protein n=1 Tax=Streblomastix strix TaxID=222440 RepID=A0A5J4V625_9EUKA|nr:MAG: hypothetical protein EZS28_026106 [Streblomastix strix]
MSEVLRQASIHPQRFSISRYEFFDQFINQLACDGQRYTRAPLGARGNTTCSMVQSCLVNQQITIPGERLAHQLNLVPWLGTPANTKARTRAKLNFNRLEYPQAEWAHTMECGAEENQLSLDTNENVQFWIRYSTAFGPFQQISICKDNSKLWEITIYAREQAAIAVNSLQYQYSNNSVSVSSLKSTIRGRKH